MPKMYPNKVDALALVAVAESPTNGIVMLVKPEHPEKAEEPILTTLSGMVMVVKLVQSLNAYEPILVTLFGITICVKLTQLRKL